MGLGTRNAIQRLLAIYARDNYGPPPAVQRAVVWRLHPAPQLSVFVLLY
jgi:hypothetical protein